MTARKNNQGFTLLELLTVVAIIGVLAAIAIPQFALYRQKTFDARAVSDLRNAAGAEEYYFASNQEYITCATAAACESKLSGYNRSAGVSLAMTSATNAYTGTASHSSGTKTFTYDSQNGGIQ
jgi:type IV pilus assembly protein PilA